METSLKLTQNEIIRENILSFEDSLKKNENVFLGDSNICPLKHSFCDGFYVREIFIPAGTVLTGKIHKHEHPNFLMSGEVEVVTEFNGIERMAGPVSMISSAGTKRVVHAITDTVWITVHLNLDNTQDLSKIEKYVIAESYEDYSKFINSASPYKKIQSAVNWCLKKLKLS